MELLLLDTTEREGEDNKLYHFCAHSATSSSSDGKRTTSTWRGLRGVLAAAVGTTASVCGEPLQCAHFTTMTNQSSSSSASSNASENSDLVGFVNLYQVLYVLVFPAAANVPIAVVQTELAMLEPLEPLENTAIAGRCVRFRKCVVLSTIRPDMLRLVNQWLVAPSKPFSAHASFVSTTALHGFTVSTYELHDVRFARHGRYSKRHTLLVLERDDLQVFYVIEKALRDADKPISRALVQKLNVQVLLQLVDAAMIKLSGYLELIRAARLHSATASLSDHRRNSSSTSASPKTPQQRNDPRARFLSYVVVHDLLRDALIGASFDASPLCSSTLDSGGAIKSQQHAPAAAVTRASSAYAGIFSLFAERIAAFQQIAVGHLADTADASKRLDESTWVTPLKLDVNDPNTLFLHEVSADAGDDISTEDAHVFPPHGETLVTASPAHERMETLVYQRLVHQEAESHVVTGDDGERQRLWIVTNYYETIRMFAVFDARHVTLEAIEREVDRLCVFGGAATVDDSSSSSSS